MGENKNQSRRSFLSRFFPGAQTGKKEMVKMLTADGKLVEVEKSVFEAATKKQKASNKDILSWMDNPSTNNG